MNNLEIKHLRMLRAIDQTGNLTRAAENLFLSQSALSQQLKDIEGKLQVDLFFRTKKKMVLTPPGKHLLNTAEQVLDILEKAELEIARIVSGEKGELKVGTYCIFCYKWLPAILGEFQEKFPNIEFELGNSEDIAQDLESKKFDLVISGRVEKSESLAAIPLFEDQLVCIMAADHHLRHKPFIRFEDFNCERFISFTEKNKTKFYQLFFKARGIKPQKFMTVTQPAAIIEMVAAGFGISIFPRWAINTSLNTDQIVARPISQSGFRLTWYATFLPNNNMNIFHREFINLISKKMQNGGSSSQQEREYACLC